MNIKPFSFIDYVSNKSYDDPRYADITLEHAGSGASSKVPILFNFDEDWAFLSQFEVQHWDAMFHWRYSEGLLQASEAREKEAEKDHGLGKHINGVKDWVREIVVTIDGKEVYFTGKPKQGVFVGYRKMFERFEKPIKYNQQSETMPDLGYSPIPSTSANGPPITHINPYAKTPEEAAKYIYHDSPEVLPTEKNPKGKPANPGIAGEYNGEKLHHAGAYEDGAIGMDLSNPSRFNFEGSSDDHPDMLNAMKKYGVTTAAEAREKAKTDPNQEHRVEGMDTMKSAMAGKLLERWAKAQGLGILGLLNVGDTIKDPLTGELLKVVRVGPPTGLSAKTHVGHNPKTKSEKPHSTESFTAPAKGPDGKWIPNGTTITPKSIPLNVPWVKKKIWPYFQMNDKEELVQASGAVDATGEYVAAPYEVEMPILMNQKVLPNIPGLTKDTPQYKRFDERNKYKKSADEVLDHWDLFSDDQKKEMINGSLDQLHYAAYQATNAGGKNEYKNKFHKEKTEFNKFLNLGWDANNNRIGQQRPTNLPKDKMGAAIKAYISDDSERMERVHGTRGDGATIKKGDKWIAQHEDEFCFKYDAGQIGCGTQIPASGCNGKGLMGEAYEGFIRFMIFEAGVNPATGMMNISKAKEGRATPQTVEMLVEKADAIIRTIAYELSTHINDRDLGIYDEEMGLTGLRPEYRDNPKIPWAKRVEKARYLVRLIEQKDLGGYGTRRKGREYTNRSNDTAIGDNGESGAGNIAAGQGEKKSDLEKDSTAQDTQLRIAKRGTYEDSPNSEDIKIVSKRNRKPTGLDPVLDAEFNKIQKKVERVGGVELGADIERIKKREVLAPKVWDGFFEKTMKDLRSTYPHLSEEDRKKIAEDQVNKDFDAKLKAADPELFSDLSTDQLKELMKKRKENHEKISQERNVNKTPEEIEEEKRLLEKGGVSTGTLDELRKRNIDFIEGLIGQHGQGDKYHIQGKGFDAQVVSDPEAEKGLTIQELAVTLQTGNSLAHFISNELYLGRNGVNQYFVRLWMKIKEGVTQSEAVQEAQQLGYSPAEASSKEETPQSTEQKPEDLPTVQKPQQQYPTATDAPKANMAAIAKTQKLLQYVYLTTFEQVPPEEARSKVTELLNNLAKYKADPDTRKRLTEFLGTLQKPSSGANAKMAAVLVGDFLK